MTQVPHTDGHDGRKAKRGRACRRMAPLLQAAAEDRLPKAEERSFHAHLFACQACRRELEGLRRLRRWAAELPGEPLSADFFRRLQARIAAGEGTPPAALEGPIPAVERVRFFVSGAVTAAALLISAWLVADGLGLFGEPVRPRALVAHADRGGPPPARGRAPFEAEARGSVPQRLATAQPGHALAGTEAPVFAVTPVDPVVLARRLLRRTADDFTALKAEAARIRRAPPAEALSELQVRSRRLQQCSKLVRALNRRLFELDPESEGFFARLERSMREIEQLCCRPHADRRRVEDALARLEALRRPDRTSMRILLDGDSGPSSFRELVEAAERGGGLELLRRFLEESGFGGASGGLIFSPLEGLLRVQIRRRASARPPAAAQEIRSAGARSGGAGAARRRAR